MKQYTLTMRQIRMAEGVDTEKPDLSVSNPDPKKNGPQTLNTAVSRVNQKNTTGANLKSQTSDFSNKPMTPDTQDAQTILPNNSQSVAKITKDINTGKASGSYILQNGVEYDGEQVNETVTFSKDELDDFLRSI